MQSLELAATLAEAYTVLAKSDALQPAALATFLTLPLLFWSLSLR